MRNLNRFSRFLRSLQSLLAEHVLYFINHLLSDLFILRGYPDPLTRIIFRHCQFRLLLLLCGRRLPFTFSPSSPHPSRPLSLQPMWCGLKQLPRAANSAAVLSHVLVIISTCCLLVHSFLQVQFVVIDVKVVEEPKDRESSQFDEVEPEEDGEKVEDPSQQELSVQG
jgi:hypothetical protein